ncbi:hypothetical protein GCM10009782_34250 [Glycomyces algeriensis]
MCGASACLGAAVPGGRVVRTGGRGPDGGPVRFTRPGPSGSATGRQALAVSVISRTNCVNPPNHINRSVNEQIQPLV